MPKLLIADPSTTRAEQLEKVLQTKWDIHICTDSYPVIDTIKYLDPEAMIINLNLYPKDGLTILEEAFPQLPPVVLALSNYTSHYVLTTTESLGVGSVMRTPCNVDHIAQRLNDMQETYQESPTIITRHLRTLGFDTSLSGYRCLAAAIAYYAEHPGCLMKEVDIAVSHMCSLNDARCAEHSQRNAIKKAWNGRDDNVWSKYVPTNKRPTKKDLILAIYEKL